MNHEALPPDLIRLHAQGSLRDVDYFLAETLGRNFGIRSPEVLLGAALASRVISDGHVCLMLAPYGETPWPPVRVDEEPLSRRELQQVTLPSTERWVRALRASDACHKPGPSFSRGDCTAIKVPLVLVEGPQPRLYLTRYYRYEQCVVRHLNALAEAVEPTADAAKQEQRILALFPAKADARPREAVATALNRRLLIISGGPGTGKTHTVARLLVLLTEDAHDQGEELLIRLAAPTGKAAMRMRESIQKARDQGLQHLTEQQRSRIPDDACTLHRLLGSRPASPAFTYHAGNPLPADVAIVDEASMIDLPLMAKLLDALSPRARLILLGDMHQLSSVEPGYVLGDICAAARGGANEPLRESLVELTHSWRFPAEGAIGKLSRALHAAGGAEDPSGTLAWDELQELAADSPGDDRQPTRVRWREAPVLLRDGERRPLNDLRRLVRQKYTPLLDADTPQAAFEAFSSFRILSPRRRGPHGIGTLNALVEEILSLRNTHLGPHDPVPPRRRLRPDRPFYDHRAIIITRNDYGLRLFNGDIGILLPEDANGPHDAGLASPRLVAWFETTDSNTGQKGYRSLPCSALPEHETAFAMTVHKSQGSQFRDLLIVIPPEDSPLLGKELLYTAITRAERSIELWCGRAQFLAAATTPVERSSGLQAALECGP